MGKYKVNGGRHCSMFNITKGKRKYGLGFSDIHGKKLFFGYFTLGRFVSPEKDWGFVFLVGGGSEVHVFTDVFPLPFPLGVRTGTSLGSVLILVSSFFKVWHWVPPGLILP